MTTRQTLRAQKSCYEKGILLAAVGVGLGTSACSSRSGVRGDQARFNEQPKRSHDRLSSEQEAEYAANARRDDMLKKP
ncbi:MAG TPA: hypothetical protein VGD81_04560 [Opitutaceae bacterium]